MRFCRHPWTYVSGHIQWRAGGRDEISIERKISFLLVSRSCESGYRPSSEGLRDFGNAGCYNRITTSPSLPACRCSRLVHGSTRSHHAREPVGSHVTMGQLRPASPVPRPALAVTYRPSGRCGLPAGPGAGCLAVSAPAQRVRARAPIISPSGLLDRPGLEACKSVSRAASAYCARRYPAHNHFSSGSLFFLSLLILLYFFFSLRIHMIRIISIDLRK